MKLFLAVSLDLVQFFATAVATFFSGKRSIERPLPVQIALAPAPAPVVVTPTDIPNTDQVSELLYTPMKRSTLLPQSEDAVKQAYVCTPVARVMQSPAWKIDTVVAELPYGTSVKILDYEGRFVRVFYAETIGWILKDEITEHESEVFPKLIPGTTYLAADAETKKLRAYIGDEFFTRELYTPLLGSEYVQYVLLRRGVRLAWPSTRPRPVGLWHTLLRGNPGIYSGITPKTSSIMEYRDESGVGYVGLVTIVTPEETITVTGVGLLAEGQFSVQVLEKAKWQEYRPIFIQVG